ncbi:MAG: YARHG domain-containing protein [Imperialibacter sp.]|uniref:YARHG domain-containing protein n=1 Tax=Imperialibacter sp. TaxID=2038411 RepID=UPI0032EECB9A
MRKLILTFLLFPNLLLGQVIVDDQVDESLITVWSTENPSGYEGVYRFGWSEWESEFYLAVDGNIISAQVKDHDWVESEDENLRGWQAQYRNYHNVRIIGNKFFSDETNGEFVRYVRNGEKINGLKLDTPPNVSESGYEIGLFQTGDKLKFFDGKYRQTKFEILSDETLKSYLTEQLKIMRNEIFARYGHAFIKGGEMAEYFGRQRWYYSLDRDATPFLTEIEKQNIAHIRAVEANKKSP